jgi:hypothetical protein
MIDPDEARYRRNHPRFPGVVETVRLLKLPGTRGGYLEAILADLGEHLPEVLDEVTRAFDEETDERVRALLVGQLAETGDRRLVGFFARLLSDENQSVAYWAEAGLQQIDTKAARQVLFDVRRPGESSAPSS